MDRVKRKRKKTGEKVAVFKSNLECELNSLENRINILNTKIQIMFLYNFNVSNIKI